MFLARHARHLTEAALLQLSSVGWGPGDGKLVDVTPAGVCIMASDQWLTCAAIGYAENGWIGASTYRSLMPVTSGGVVDLGDYPWLWHRPAVVDPTALYVEFLDLSTHYIQRTPSATSHSDVAVADLMGLSHRGLAHLAACVPDFNPEAGAFLANMTTAPDPRAEFLHHVRPWTNRQTPFMAGPSSLAATASGERCWLRWAAPKMTGGAEITDGQSRLLGPLMLRSLRHQWRVAERYRWTS